ncbi:hypothetical protein [Acetoanaerobium sticklandii]|uniref:hypothetical protein n=1 Tax=Acetoanaerobium sticklandii TaxID=1511 RepID=UPI003A8F9FDA
MNEKNMADIITFGQNLAFIQSKRDMNYCSFALSINYSRNNLSRLESGLKDINLSSAVQIANALDIDVAMLFSRSYRDDKEGCRQKGFIPGDYAKIFRENVLNIMDKNGIKQVQLCETNHEPISRLLSGHINNPRVSSLSSIASKINVSLSELLTHH